MKRITIDQLTLINFKGMNFALDAGNRDVSVYGQNRSGKTTIADAISWLLIDKDSTGRSDFAIKTLDEYGNVKHPGIDHGVESLLTVDGVKTTLRKVYHEIWTKKRGSPKATFTGNTTDYFIDGVPIQKKEFQAKVLEITGDEAVFRLLTSPLAFPLLHWEKQRMLLLEICGNITDSDVIDSEPKLKELPALLAGKSVEDRKKVVVSLRSTINKELERIPIRIDEQNRSLPDLSAYESQANLHPDSLPGLIAIREDEISALKLQLKGVDTGGNIAKLSKELAIVKADISTLETKHYNATMAAANEIRIQISDKEQSLGRAKSDVIYREAQIRDRGKEISAFEGEIVKLRESWTKVDEEEFVDVTESICAACGQSLPIDKVSEARANELARFNNDKAERKAKITIDGQALKAKKETAEASRQELIAKQLSITNSVDPEKLNKEISNLHDEYATLMKVAVDYASIPERTPLVSQKLSLEEKIKSEKAGVSEDSDKILLSIKPLEEALAELRHISNQYAKRAQGEKRIEELKIEEGKLSVEFEALEKELFLIELFIKTKVGMLETKINEKFEIAHFKLFDVQVNEGIKETCEITVGGIPYNAGLNTSTRIAAGCDVIRTLQRHYGISVPLIIDNKESVTEIPSMDCQVISLIVSPEDKGLRVIHG